ncbi:MAG: dTDP-4-dehydrorhamnose 3,5-epimerase [Rhodocyclales bacterium]|nr:dTDP-4-dehydrorhamnose 3,5-epimerase [Rhodocyclales bacterium]
MRALPLAIPEVILLEPRVHGDARGYFFEAYTRRAFFAATGVDVEFVQDNESRSRRGVLRGLHYQLPPHAQGKLVRCAEGAVFDVAVDLRRSSPTFGRWVAVELSDENKRQLWIPPGFAHGFLALSEYARLIYKTTDYYAPQCDRSLRYDDPALAIAWPDLGIAPIVSDKDRAAPLLTEAECFS